MEDFIKRDNYNRLVISDASPENTGNMLLIQCNDGIVLDKFDILDLIAYLQECIK